MLHGRYKELPGDEKAFKPKCKTISKMGQTSCVYPNQTTAAASISAGQKLDSINNSSRGSFFKANY